MQEKIIYFQRGNFINFATNRKVIKITEIFQKANLEVINLSISSQIFSGIYKNNSLIYYSKYIFELIKLLIKSFKLFRNDKAIKYCCFVDLLPDTTFAVIILKAYSFFIKRKFLIIAQIEEDIESDQVNIFFKIYSYFARKLISPKVILLINPKVKIFSNKIITIITPGIVSEKDIINIKSIEISNNKKLNILFSSRIDNQRGIYKFISLLSSLEKNEINILSEKIERINITGYGNTNDLKIFNEIIEKNKWRLKNLEKIINIEMMASHEKFMKIFNNSDVSINYIKDRKFMENSFPSKVFEALIHKKIIINFGSLPLFNEFKNIVEIKTFDKHELIRAIILIYKDKKILSQSAQNNSLYLINRFNTKLLSKKIRFIKKEK